MLQISKNLNKNLYIDLYRVLDLRHQANEARHAGAGKVAMTRVRIRRRRTPPLDAWHAPPEHPQGIRDLYALATRQRYGVWGGLAEDDRQPVADKRRPWAARERPAHGER
jgi:hypothetical protein